MMSSSDADKKMSEARKELREFLSKGFIEPNRGNLDEQKWKSAKPDYTLANLAYFKGKSKNHKEGSLEKIVEDLVKTWEMEATHKTLENWTTINLEKYCTQSNGGKIFSGKESSELGNYNWLLSGCRKDLYDADAHTFESSHQVFKGAFLDGFPWEVIDVFSPPPFVCFSWRHWATYNGTYKGKKGNDSVVNMCGFASASLDENLKICDLKIYYKPEEFLQVLESIN